MDPNTVCSSTATETLHNLITQPQYLRARTRRSTFSSACPPKLSSTGAYCVSPGVLVEPSTSDQQCSVAFPGLRDAFSSLGNVRSPGLATPPQTPPEQSAPAFPTSSAIQSSGTAITNSQYDCHKQSLHKGSASLLPSSRVRNIACTVEGDVVGRGELYLTPTHICFHGSHFDKTVNFIVHYSRVLSVTRESSQCSHSIHIRIQALPVLPAKHAWSDERVVAIKNTMSLQDYLLADISNPEQALTEITRSWIKYGGHGNTAQVKLRSIHANDQVVGRLTRSLSLCYEGPGQSSCQIAGEGQRRARTNSLVEHQLPSERHARGLMRKLVSFSRASISSHAVLEGEEPMVSMSAQSPQGSPRPSHADPCSRMYSRRVERSDGFQVAHSSDCLDSTTTDSTTDGVDLSTRRSRAQEAAAYGDLMPSQTAASLSSSTLCTSLQDYVVKPRTPPPLLLSPPLTTTKVSHSMSTVHNLATKGLSVGMNLHNYQDTDNSNHNDRKEHVLQEQGTEASSSNMASTFLDSGSVLSSCNKPTEPVWCGCDTHYKNAILSTVVPMGLQECFDFLFLENERDECLDVGARWTRQDSGSDTGMIANGWAGCTRELKYPVLLKIPILFKTFTACLETQRILQYDRHVIRVLSKSSLPGVPFGKQFSTLVQMCLTWDSPGNTRIKCFTQVDFQKFAVLSAAVEAGALERTSRFYREAIRSLVEATDTRGALTVASSKCASTLDSTSTLSTISSSTISSTSSSTSRTAMASCPSFAGQESGFTSTFMPQERIEISPAHSLLYQQYRRTLPAHSQRTRLSMDSRWPSSTFPSGAGAPQHTSDSVTGNRNTLEAISTQAERKQSYQEGEGTALVAQSTAKLTALWTDILQMSTITVRKHFVKPSASLGTSVCKLGSPMAETNVGQRGESLAPSMPPSSILHADETDSYSAEDVCAFAEKARLFQTTVESVDTIKETAYQPAMGRTWSKRSSRTLLLALALSISATLINVWYLFSAVSDLSSALQTGVDGSHSMVRVQSHRHRRHMHTREQPLTSLHAQADLLRVGMREFAQTLETIRHIHHSTYQNSANHFIYPNTDLRPDLA